MHAAAACVVAAVMCTAFGAIADESSVVADSNRAWCVRHGNDDSYSRAKCGGRAWCSIHWNDDRVTRIVCDPFRSFANLKASALSVTLGSLNTSRYLSEAEKRSPCDGSCLFAIVPQFAGKKPTHRPADPNLLPNGMINAKLAMRADISMGMLPTMVVKIGVQSADSGAISVNTARIGGPRYTVIARLNGAEIAQIVAALNKSRFWQLPENISHQGVLDGEMAGIQVSIPERQHHATDFVDSSPEAVDLAILAKAITTIVFARWKDI